MWPDMKKITTPKVPDIRKPRNSRHGLKLPKPEKLFYSSPKARVGEQSRITVGGTILHCQNGPAVKFQDGGFEWWRNGQVHRGDDLPAVRIGPTSRLAVSFHTGRNKIGFNGVSDLQPNTDLWCVDGFLHRDGKPALVTTKPNGDVILAAQALSLGTASPGLIVATTNPAHISRYVAADLWTNIQP